jgi:RecA/RadA recombinase
MPTPARLRLEQLLQGKKLDGTLLRPWMTVPGRAMSSGIGALDEALGGGWTPGEISELVGGRSSGRTGTMVCTMAAFTSRGDLVGHVDAFDRFDPAGAAAAGVALDRVLWVRGPACTVEHATPALLDRAIHHAIRACDLIVRAGGFALVTLDLAEAPPRLIGSLPAATWLRLARALEGRDTVVLLMGEAPMGRSARGATVRLEGSRRWGGHSARSRRFDGFAVRASISQAWRPAGESPVWSLETGGQP